MTARGPDRTLAVLRAFLDRVHIAPPGGLPEVVQGSARELGWDALIYLVDYQQTVLVPLVPPGMPAASPQPVDSTLAGRAYQHVLPVVSATTPPVLWVPLLDGGERLGVLRLGLPDGTDIRDPAVRDRYRLFAHLVGHLTVAKRVSGGDALEIPRRQAQRTIASELLWELLPPQSFACPGLVVSGLLEPSYDVAADAFDYSVLGSTAHLAILDATGHDLTGTLLAAVALAALRNSRRERRSLFDTVRTVDDVLAEQWGSELFVTGVIAELDLPTGRLRYINAGHPSPLLMRRGKVVRHLDGGRRIVLGIGEAQATVAEEHLEPDDWIVFYTDGVTEARDGNGTFYGLDRLVDQLERSAAAGMLAPETLRRTIHGVLEHQGGMLQDDATVLVAQWRTGAEEAMFADRPSG